MADGPQGVPCTPASTPPAHDPRIHRVLLDGRFIVIERIGQGGMGSVYRAKNREVGNEVAVKFLDLKHTGSNSDGMKARFYAETDALMSLEDARIPKVIARGQTAAGEPFVVTELLRGRTLAEELAEFGQLDPLRVAWIVQEVCFALFEAHARGIIHRDIKPSNLFIQEIAGGLERVRVLDFGIARIVHEFGAMTTLRPNGKEPTIGTPQYFSPEQARGVAVVPESDLYSLGIVAYECLTGEPPFAGDFLTLRQAHQHTEPRPLMQTASGVDINPRLAQLVTKMLAKDPRDRPSSAQEVAQALAELDRSSAHPPTPPKPDRRSGWWTTALGAAALAGLATAYYELRMTSAPPAVGSKTQTVAEAPAPAPAPPVARTHPPKRSVRILKYEAIQIPRSTANERAKKQVLAAARRCYQRSYRRSSPRVAFTFTAFAGAPPVAVAPKAERFSRCLTEAISSVRFEVQQDGLASVVVGRTQEARP